MFEGRIRALKLLQSVNMPTHENIDLLIVGTLP